MSPTRSPSASPPAARRPAPPASAASSPAAVLRSPASGLGAASRRGSGGPLQTLSMSHRRAASGEGLPTPAPCLGSRAVTPGRGAALELVRLDHPVDQTILDRLLGLEEFVPFHVGVDLLRRLPRVFDVDLVKPLAQGEDLFGVDLDVARLAFEATAGLVDEDAAVGQGHPFAGGAAGEDQRPR